jgi:mannosyl-oligosaccharide glucosidase
MSQKRSAFDAKFVKVYNITQSRFDQDETLKPFKDQGVQFSKEALSDLLGGISYFWGPIQIKQEDGSGKYDDPAGLYTHVPARQGFPRGFLWDEGFHLHITCQWSRFICIDSLKHWFNS